MPDTQRPAAAATHQCNKSGLNGPEVQLNIRELPRILLQSRDRKQFLPILQAEVPITSKRDPQKLTVHGDCDLNLSVFTMTRNKLIYDDFFVQLKVIIQAKQQTERVMTDNHK